MPKKKCSQCGVKKSLVDFHYYNKKQGKRRCDCKACRKDKADRPKLELISYFFPKPMIPMTPQQAASLRGA